MSRYNAEQHPNSPAGDTEEPVISDEELHELIGGATLVRYSEGTEEHAGNIMAVFERPDGRGIGLTMTDDSDTPEKLIGETVREPEKKPFHRGSGFEYGTAYILFAGLNSAYDKIIVRNTASMGVYEVDL